MACAISRGRGRHSDSSTALTRDILLRTTASICRTAPLLALCRRSTVLIKSRRCRRRLADRGRHIALGRVWASSWGVKVVALRPAAALMRALNLVLLTVLAACAEHQALPSDPTGRLFARGLDQITDLYISPVSSRKLVLAGARSEE